MVLGAPERCAAGGMESTAGPSAGVAGTGAGGVGAAEPGVSNVLGSTAGASADVACTGAGGVRLEAASDNAARVAAAAASAGLGSETLSCAGIGRDRPVRGAGQPGRGYRNGGTSHGGMDDADPS